MADTGKELGADLYRLLVVAKNCLPSVAGEVHEAKARVDKSAAAVGDAMKRPDFFGGAQGPVHGAWVALHQSLSRFLADTEDSLDDTGRALELAVSRYAESDRAAADELARLRRDNGEPRVGG